MSQAPTETPRSRVPLLLAAVVAVLLVALGATLPAVLDDDDAAAAADAAAADLSEVVTFTTLRTDHVTETVDDYESRPPAGGRHFPVWLECGVHDEPVREEYLVHDLEHGAFWFAYDAEVLDDEEVEALAAQLPDNGVMTPYVGLGSPVVVTVWEAQLALDGADDPRLDLFLEEYAGSPAAPEPMSSCAGGATLEEIEQLALPTDVTTG